MAEVKEEDQQKKGGILKIILFVIGGIFLIVLGLFQVKEWMYQIYKQLR